MWYSRHTNPTKARPTKARNKIARSHKIVDVWARAPYNFVPLPEKVVPAELFSPDHDMYKRHTGHITCTLKTLTPLYIRGLLSRKNFNEYGEKRFNDLPLEQKRIRSKFNSIDENQPFIPGSSLRGMIRAVAEILTYSKVEWVTKEPLVYRAVADKVDSPLGKTYRSQLLSSHVRAGYMMKTSGGWQIRPAQQIDGFYFATFRGNKPEGKKWCESGSSDPIANALKVKIGLTGELINNANSKEWRINEINPKSGTGREAVYVFTAPAVGKNFEEKNQYLFGLPDLRVMPLNLSEEIIQRYKNQITTNDKYSQAEFLKNKDGVFRDNQPVFYLIDASENIIFLGHARYFRLPYQQSPFDLIPPELKEVDEIDLTDTIFGYMGKGKGNKDACAGKVSFSDAQLKENQEQPFLEYGSRLGHDWITPEILASPKPTTFAHYLTQNAANNHEPDCKQDLAHYGTNISETSIRGYKRYWSKSHVQAAKDFEWQPNANEQTYADFKGKSQLTGIQPVKPQILFEFKIHFENLSDVELGALLWATELVSYSCHSLGMGKPLGLGAVKITINDLVISNRSERYQRLFNESAWATGDKQSNETKSTYRDAFENYITQALSNNLTGETSKYEELNRIKLFLVIQSWIERDPELTRYMKIERKLDDDFGVNEYLERPVLPDPLHIDPRACEQQTRKPRPCIEPEPQANNKTTGNIVPSIGTIGQSETLSDFNLNSDQEKFANSFGKLLPSRQATQASFKVTIQELRRDRKFWVCVRKGSINEKGLVEKNEKAIKDKKIGDEIDVYFTNKRTDNIPRWTTIQ